MATLTTFQTYEYLLHPDKAFANTHPFRLKDAMEEDRNKLQTLSEALQKLQDGKAHDLFLVRPWLF